MIYLPISSPWVYRSISLYILYIIYILYMGFRPERSTSDVVWTHRWLAAKTVTENINIKITGIDMSAVFDTIDRDILLQIVRNVVEEDELRLIQFLLSNTHINTRINNADINAPFTSNVCAPQGDGLSPMLFTIISRTCSERSTHSYRRAQVTFRRENTKRNRILRRRGFCRPRIHRYRRSAENTS